MDHTPGPWESPGLDSGARVICATIDGKRRTIAHVYGWSKNYPNDAIMAANSQLIAAAPAMLEALKYVIHGPNSVCPEIAAVVNAVIAKVEGGE